MNEYRHKTTGQEVDAVTFDELVDIGREQNPVREGMPWSFDIWGYHVSHERDNCYLVGQTCRVRPHHRLVYQQGQIHLWDNEAFLAEFTPVTEPPRPTETEMIEAAEKSANFMLGLAARARGALRLEEDNRRMSLEHERLRKEIHAAVQDKLEAQHDLKTLKAALEARPARDASAVRELRQALDAEGYDLPALAAMAIQKIRDLDRCLTESKGEAKLINKDRAQLRQAVDSLRHEAASIHQNHDVALRELRDTRSEEDRVKAAHSDMAELHRKATHEADTMFQQLQSIRNYHAAEVARNGALLDQIDALRHENGRQAATIAAMKQH